MDRWASRKTVLYLLENWAKNLARWKAAGTAFPTKRAIALAQIRQALEQGIPTAPVVADAAYGNDSQFREGATALHLRCAVGRHENMTVWQPSETPQPKPRRPGKGRPAKRFDRDAEHRPLAVKELALALPVSVWKTVTWREGTRHEGKSRLAAVRVRPAHRDPLRSGPHPEEWPLMEWPKSDTEPAKYRLSTLPPQSRRTVLVRLAKHR